MKAALNRIARGVADAVFRPSCVHCRGLVEVDGVGAGAGDAGFRHLCSRCVARIDFVRPPACSTCGSPFFGEIEGERQCPHCEGLHAAFREGRTAVLFKGPSRALVIESKYHRGLHVLADMEAIFRRAPHVAELAKGARLVPVPLHPRKERHRGYNQTGLLAAILGAWRVGEPASKGCCGGSRTRRPRRRWTVAHEWRI